MICPNLSNPTIKAEFDELKSALGEDMAYLMWNRNNGFHLDKTATGKPSKLFNDLLGLTDRKGAIEIKAKTLSNSFKQWFGESKVVDENGEPLVVYHGGVAEITSFSKDSQKESAKFGKKFYFTNNKNATEFYKELVKEGNVQTYPVFLNNAEIENPYDDLKNLEYIVNEPNQIKSIFNTGVFNRYSDNIYDNDLLMKEENRQQTKVNGSMSTEIMQNFEAYFPDYNHFNNEQRAVVANLVEQGKIQLVCTI